MTKISDRNTGGGDRGEGGERCVRVMVTEASGTRK